jgi:prolyl-tRNA editing enzyme YbaK/EbsC (Cys-tRNA(Pro) deacylase)
VDSWPQPVERVAAVLREAQLEARIEEFPAGTASAEDAATAVGCKPAQIVKSLVLMAGREPAVVLVPGDRRVDTAKVAAKLGVDKIRFAGGDQVRSLTGFEPGAVAPFPLPGVKHVFADRALLTQPELWIGAGSDTHLAVLKPADLMRLAGATAMDAAERPG